MNKDKYIITKIEVQKRNKDRVNIYINDEFAFACSVELVYTHGLSKDKIIEKNSLEEIVNEDNYIKCKNTSLKMLERSHKTEKQITDKLIEKGYDEKVVKRTKEFLKQYDFINDDRYVQMYIKDKMNSQGRNKVKYDLINKGICEERINEKLCHIDRESEENSAFKLAEKKYNLLIKSEQDIRIINRKLREYLTRKGYNLDIIQNVLNQVIKQDVDTIYEKESEGRFNGDIEKLYELGEKRYKILIKSESDVRKLYKKLGDYLLRRGYSWSDIKEALNNIIKDSYI